MAWSAKIGLLKTEESGFVLQGFIVVYPYKTSNQLNSRNNLNRGRDLCPFRVPSSPMRSVGCGFAVLCMYLFLRRPHVWQNKVGDFSLLCNLYVFFLFHLLFIHADFQKWNKAGRQRKPTSEVADAVLHSSLPPAHLFTVLLVVKLSLRIQSLLSHAANQTASLKYSHHSLTDVLLNISPSTSWSDLYFLNHFYWTVLL